MTRRLGLVAALSLACAVAACQPGQFGQPTGVQAPVDETLLSANDFENTVTLSAAEEADQERELAQDAGEAPLPEEMGPPEFVPEVRALVASNGIDINPDRELIIRQIGVVNDARAKGVGAWSFGRLMANMAGSQNAAVFTEKFIRQWLVNKSLPNGDMVAARAKMKTLVLDKWPRDKNRRLILSRAPFRLLAIVNRMDLGFPGTQNVGEGRFIYGLVDSKGRPLQFTLILEFALPVSAGDPNPAKTWASRWHALHDLVPGTAAYNTKLQAVTDLFTRKGAIPARPNGSAINQVRSNEIALGSPWQLREFRLNATTPAQLVTMPAKNTPRLSLRETAALRDIINNNKAAITAGTFVLPATQSGAASMANGMVWRGAAGTDPVARRHFAANTCNGCHQTETNTFFLHVGPRAANGVAPLSRFLSPDGVTVPDPSGAGVTLTFTPLKDRVENMAAILGDQPTPAPSVLAPAAGDEFRPDEAPRAH